MGSSLSFENGGNITYLESFNNVAVVSGGGHNRISSCGVTDGLSPAEGRFLHYVVGLHEQIIHLTVQINRNGYGSAFGCTIIKPHTVRSGLCI